MGLPFHLRCLGRPQLISPGGEPVRLRVRKHLALLVYLALEPRGQHRRERMADLLWPNVSPRDGRHSVATATSMLRGKLGRELVHGDRDTIQLLGPGLEVDLDRLAAGRILGDEFVPILEIGGFLEDFEITDAPEFMMWRERQRARWLPMVRDALVLLIDRCRRTGDFRRIEQLGDSLLDIDDLSEDGIRAKMEARAFDGDRVGALKTFQVWKEKLSSELDAEPSELVEGIAVRLRQRGWEPAPVTNIPTVPTDQWRGRPFIGRAQEYESLYNAWEATCKQAPSHMLVLGDSGVGKSTLLERVVTAAGLEGAAIARVQCYELEREIPYAAVDSLIEGLLERSGAASTPPEWLAELARTVPLVRRLFPGIPEPMDTQGETARIRLTEAVQQLVASIAEEHPVILVLDDIHLADDASLAVLHLMMRRNLEKRLMVLMAARSGEMRQAPHAVKLLEGHEHLNMKLLDLQPLSPAESDTLLEKLLQLGAEQPSHTVRRALLKSAAGFPMVLEYLVKDWETNGERCLALSLGAMTEEPWKDSAPSKTYHLILTRLVNALEPTVRNVLSMASVLGSRLNDINYYSLADVSVGQALMGLGKLADLRILRDGTRGLEFSNELVRGEAYLGITSSIRKSLHRSISDQMLSDLRDGAAIPGLEIAWHLMRAGRAPEAIFYLLKGARQAIDRGAPHEAENGLTTAMGYLKEPARTDALLLLAEALGEQGKWESVLMALGECVFEHDDQRKSAAVLLSMEPRRRLSLTYTLDSADLVADTLGLASPANEVLVRVGAISTAAYFLAHNRNEGLSHDLRLLLNSLPQKELSDEQFAKVATARALIDYHDRDLSAAIIGLIGALKDLRDRGLHNLSIVALQTALANLEAASGAYESAIAHYREAYQMADQLGNDPMCGILAANMGMCAMRLGEYQQTADWYCKVIAFDRDLKQTATGNCLYHTAMANAVMGKLDAAMDVVSKLEGILRQSIQPSYRQSCHLYLADCYLLVGRRREGLIHAQTAIGRDAVGPFSHNCAGAYSRWVAAIHHESRPSDVPCMALEDMVRQRHQFDRIDQTEVLAASLWLKSKASRIASHEARAFVEELQQLPVGVSDQLRRLGFLSFLDRLGN